MGSARTGTRRTGRVRTTVEVTGMTCHACEVHIGEELRAVPGVQKARVSARAGTAQIISVSPVPRDAIRAAVQRAGYDLGARSMPWRDVLVSAAIVVAAVVALRLVGADDAVGRLAEQASSGGSLLFVAALGALASVSTCMALVGGIVLGISASAQAGPGSGSAAGRLVPHIAFNAGRIGGFAALGALVGLLGRAVAPDGAMRGLLTLAVALVMALLGLRLTGISPRASVYSPTLPSGLARWLPIHPAGGSGTGAEPRARLLGRAGLAGVATFFLPCGFTQAVQVYALSTGNPASAAAVMAAFAVGTTPGLLALGAAGSEDPSATNHPPRPSTGGFVLPFSPIQTPHRPPSGRRTSPMRAASRSCARPSTGRDTDRRTRSSTRASRCAGCCSPPASAARPSSTARSSGSGPSSSSRARPRCRSLRTSPGRCTTPAPWACTRGRSR